MNLRRWKKILSVAYLVAVAPLLMIAVYNHASADDYWYSVVVKHGLDERGLAGVISGIAATVSNSYRTWQGTYSGIVLFSLQPSIFGERFYTLTTFVMLFVLTVSIIYFLRCLSDKILGIPRDLADIISLVVLILSVELLPSAVEGLFWWNGASFYVIFYSLMLVEGALFINILTEPKRSHIIWAFILAIVLGGGNYVVGILTFDCAVLFLFSAFAFLKGQEKRKIKLCALLISVVYIVCFMINILAPGNAKRAVYFEGMAPVKAILASFHYSYRYLCEWLKMPVILAALFLAVFFIGIPVDEDHFSKVGGGKKIITPPGMLLSFLAALCIFSSSFTPNLYAQSYEGEGRIQNIRFFFFLLILFVLEACAVMLVKRVLYEAFQLKVSPEHKAVFYKAVLKWYIIPIIAFMGIFIVDTHEFGNRNTITSLSAAVSLRFGEAKQYGRENVARVELLKSDDKNIEFQEFTVKPYLLYFTDITESMGSWLNQYMTEYYNKDSIILKYSD